VGVILATQERLRKSELGRKMLAEHRRDIPTALGPLLLMIFGDKTTTEYREIASKLPAGADGITQLLKHGWIEVIPKSGAAKAVVLTETSKSTSTSSAVAAATDSLPTQEASARHRLLYPVFVQAVADLGFRGVMMQMKVERAMTAQALLELQPEMEKAILKAKGESARAGFSALVANSLPR
jgi:hypothetical protein